MSGDILRDLSQLRSRTRAWRQAGETLAVVPTMGALHAGHLSLVAAAKQRAARVIVTIFVNPKQFNSAEDLANYPRTEEEDARKLGPFNVDAIWVPDGDTVYPTGFATTVSVAGVTEVMDGVHRPGHFAGVATVVAKLLLQTSAELAFFGEKDFQQLQVVRRMVADLNIPVEVIGCPTVREDDGLAMSSRNALLSPKDRPVAGQLFAEMQTMAEGIRRGGPVPALAAEATSRLTAAGFERVEYLDLRSTEDLAQLIAADRPARLFAAAHLGSVRLIDNIPV
ncbi:MAG: pantoate--beta-alanine ligase [Rhodobacteraceae bacterium]|nr:pantoate--beta-alanine ligase [Paracoccaceae bacterium]